MFYDRFHELFRCSRVSGRITTTIRTDTCLTILTKKLWISHIMAVFMSYCPQFWGSRVIYNDPKTRYMFESYDKNSSFFTFYGRFRELLHPILALLGDLQRS